MRPDGSVKGKKEVEKKTYGDKKPFDKKQIDKKRNSKNFAKKEAVDLKEDQSNSQKRRLRNKVSDMVKKLRVSFEL